MDKLKDETWDNYALRHHLYIIEYRDEERKEIKDVILPLCDESALEIGRWSLCLSNNDVKLYNKTFTNKNRPSFTYIIQYKLNYLHDKYNLSSYDLKVEIPRFLTFAKDQNEDISREEWLYTELDYWLGRERKVIKEINEKEEQKNEERYKRIFELKNIISKTYSAELDEFSSLLLSDLNFFRSNLKTAFKTYKEYLTAKKEYKPTKEENGEHEERLQRKKMYYQYMISSA